MPTHNSQDLSLNHTVRHVDGASIELALGRDIWNATCDFGPQRLTVTVVREEGRRLPYWWEVVDVLGSGPVRIHRAFEVRIM
jgi:hypothetical protein